VIAGPAKFELKAPVGPPARRRGDRRRSASRDADRLMTMLVMAVLLHGLLILGIRFRADIAAAPAGIGMEVLLVSDELPESRENRDARYLAQRTQVGSGNTTQRTAARLPGTPVPEQAATSPAVAGDDTGERTLESPGGRVRTHYYAESPPGAAEAAADPTAQLAPPRAEADTELLLRGTRRDELYVSPDTRSAEIAPYLASWKRRVERVGTINYPSAAQREGLTGSPVLEVVIGADGQLRSAVIRRSSGHAEIDAAALDILRLASPFEAFPSDLAARHDQLRFAYEWQFQGGRLRGSVSLP
jgi:protein TonB